MDGIHYTFSLWNKLAPNLHGLTYTINEDSPLIMVKASTLCVKETSKLIR